MSIQEEQDTGTAAAIPPAEEEAGDQPRPPGRQQHLYNVRFRREERPLPAKSRLAGLKPGEVVMVHTEKGLEPAVVAGGGLPWQEAGVQLAVARKGTPEDIAAYERLVVQEREAFELCRQLVVKHQLVMKLVRVERFFNGSKIIFYFTAESRVDFRALVRDLVREYKTRVEMRQIGVRHEAKMTGGLGCCGRELCCASYLGNFAPVSIRMAKEQNLPLNPAKISGCCNRLLCCLTYEFPTYAACRKGMPKVGKNIVFKDQTYKVIQHNPLQETIRVKGSDDKELELAKGEWEEVKRKK